MNNNSVFDQFFNVLKAQNANPIASGPNWQVYRIEIPNDNKNKQTNKCQCETTRRGRPNQKEELLTGFNFPGIKRVIFSGETKRDTGEVLKREVTVVFFDDGTKVMVRRCADDNFSREHALMYAIMKRLFGRVDPDNKTVHCYWLSDKFKEIINNSEIRPDTIIQSELKKEQPPEREIVKPWPKPLPEVKKPTKKPAKKRTKKS